MHKKLIVILGQTASGKTDLSITLAKKFNGEIVSADSRQVYKGLDIGSGKIPRDRVAPHPNGERIKTNNKRVFEKNSVSFAKNSSVDLRGGIPHYLLDVANPKRKFSVAQYQKLALRAIKKIHAKKKIPFLVGGTGFYIQSVVDGIVLPEVKPNWKLRKKLQKKSNKELFSMLEKLDPQRAASIDAKNPRRLIRAIEIIKSTGSPVPKAVRRPTSYSFDTLQIGIKKAPDELKKLIQKRLQKRIKGIIAEVKKLHLPQGRLSQGLSLRKRGVSWKRLEELGLEYRFVAQYIQDKITYQEMVVRLQKEIEHFSKRQMTWFSAHGGSASGGKRDKKIHWIKKSREAEKLVKEFLQ